MADIIEVPFATVAPLAGRAAREKVAITDTRNTRWWAVYDGTKLIGAAGLLRFSSIERIKGLWLHPDYRGAGLGKAIYKVLLDAASENCASALETYAVDPESYERKGFTRLPDRPLPSGAIRVRKNL